METTMSLEELQLKSDVVLLVDLITEHSRKVELVSYDDLKKEFLEKAALTPSLTEEDIRKALDTEPEMLLSKQLEGQADDSPEGKEKRRVMSRRQMFKHFFGDEEELPKETKEQAEPRELTEEDFDKVLAKGLEGHCRIEELVSWDKVRYFIFTPLLSASYARFLSAKNNPYELILDTIRENSRVYPRPLGLYTFEYHPFCLTPEEIKGVLARLEHDENAKDIRVSVTSTDHVYLYSSKYLEDDYADFLAEEMDKGAGESL